MLISQNGDFVDKAVSKNAKMNSVDLNNVDVIKEKSSSLNTQKIKNINNLVQHNAVDCEKKDKNFCNNELKKHISILFIILFLVTFFCSAAAFCFITFTNKFNEGIVEHLVLKNDTKSMEWWKDSPIQPLIKLYIFNYTNIDEYMRNPVRNKIKVQEVGPYVYKEYGQRVHLEFSEDHRITFKDNKTLEFIRDQSVGDEDDALVVPNIPLLAAFTKLKERNMIENIGFNGILSATNPKEFNKRTVKEYMFGYSDELINMTPNMEPDRVGLMSGRKGESVDTMTVYTGEDSLDNLGRIHAMNGETKLNIWGTDECNEIVGTDGSQFPPHLMDKEQELKIFLKSFCRFLTLKFEREVTVLNGIPAWRYKVPEGGFDSSRKNPDYKCYCDAEVDPKCTPDGVFDASKCVDGIPLLLSYPHFLEGDPSLLTHFEGLKPNRKLHETYADIHPRMAFPIGGASRLQMNFRVESKSILFGSSWYTKLPKDLILPIFWFEVTAGEIPPEFQALVFHTSQSANATYLAIQYSSLITSFVSFLLLISTSYFYFIRLMKNSTEKVQNTNVVVTFNSTSQTPASSPIKPTAPNMYQNTSNLENRNTSH